MSQTHTHRHTRSHENARRISDAIHELQVLAAPGAGTALGLEPSETAPTRPHVVSCRMYCTGNNLYRYPFLRFPLCVSCSAKVTVEDGSDARERLQALKGAPSAAPEDAVMTGISKYINQHSEPNSNGLQPNSDGLHDEHFLQISEIHPESFC